MHPSIYPFINPCMHSFIHPSIHLFILLITIAGGQTIHSFAGIGIGAADTKTLVNKVSKSTLHKERWMRTKVLVVDEISMLDKHVFEVLDQIARQLKELDEPFGGMQVLVVGDFMQLPPVNKDRRNRSEFCFESPVWKEAGLNDVKGSDDGDDDVYYEL
jgi:ATP-dependent exoDNAse (exonuclease V) alpha subunit